MRSGPPFKHLVPGGLYRVAKPFDDFDGIRHPEGETWRFLGHSFLPYEDGLSLFVTLDGRLERQIRLRWDATAQGEIVDNLADYIIAGTG